MPYNLVKARGNQFLIFLSAERALKNRGLEYIAQNEKEEASKNMITPQKTVTHRGMIVQPYLASIPDIIKTEK